MKTPLANTDGPQVVEELKQIIITQVFQKRLPNKKYERMLKRGKYIKYD